MHSERNRKKKLMNISFFLIHGYSGLERRDVRRELGPRQLVRRRGLADAAAPQEEAAAKQDVFHERANRGAGEGVREDALPGRLRQGALSREDRAARGSDSGMKSAEDILNRSI